VRSIGSKGAGPGEFFFPSAIAVDAADRLYVASRGRVTIFGADGEYVEEFRYGFADGFTRSVAVGSNGGIYISSLDLVDQQIVHFFDGEAPHELVRSFCDSYAVGRDVDTRVESAFAGGAIDIDDEGMVYFSQLTPYEIRKYAPDGTLVMTIHRENSFIGDPIAEDKPDGGFRIGTPTMCYSVVVMDDGRILNVAKRPITSTEPKTIVDAFAADGTLLTTVFLERNVNIKCAGTGGTVYAIDYDDFPSVVRYNVVFR
jgi:hypothetical protein